jgi:wyosine [tRNA(Phe)-imidazoG37] synthetase (radical SAM superfamily)
MSAPEDRVPNARGRVYGPVPSRRLGRSLGIDLVPLKACTFDCVYCQLGRTTHKTLERRSFFALEPILEEAAERLARIRPDYVTVAGSGEPTLEARLGELLEALKGLSNVPVALLTNGSLLWDEEVQRAAALADVVIPSLDAGDEEFFQWVNRPADGLSLEQVLGGLVSFRGRYAGSIWLEVMVLAGMTETRGRLQALADAAARVRPERIQLNTPVRPGGQDFAVPLPPDRLEGLCGLFEPRAEAVAGPSGTAAPVEGAPGGDVLLALLRRRPCTLEDLCGGLGSNPNEVLKILTPLFSEKKVHLRASARGLFYFAGKASEGSAPEG